MKLPNLVESQQLDLPVLDDLFARANSIREEPREYSSALQGRILASLFYEPSTRTRISFESAMLRLGGHIVGTENAREFSSVVKGESLEDTVRVIGAYADGIAMRHNTEGAAKQAAAISPVPIINAGDGTGQHPTQALLDVYTIKREQGRLTDLNIALVGDLASGRTARSLCYLIGKFEDSNHLTFVSPPNLKMRDDIKEYLNRHHVSWCESEDLNEVLPKSDIIYMTRIQKERLSLEDYEQARGKYIINKDNLELIKPDSRILHPLPHVEEIDLPIEIEQTDQRIAYFRQVENGLYARMALLLHLLT